MQRMPYIFCNISPIHPYFILNNNMTDRKYFIDWVRVLAFLLLIFFHCAMPFVSFAWEVKDSHQSMGLSRLIWWLHQWRLPLLFFVSGVGTHFSLRKRSVFAFEGERVVRLFIPLLFAMFFTIPFQVYFAFLQRGKIAPGYGNFYPSVWQFTPYPDGALSWSHMWFVVYLFVFCILLIPVFAIFKIKGMQRVKILIADKLSNPFVLLLLLIPLVLYYLKLYIRFPEQMSLLDDWFLFLFSLTLFFYGYLLGGSEKFWDTCAKYRWTFLSVACTSIVVLYIRYWWRLEMPKEQGPNLDIYGVLNSIEIWCIILAILGFAKTNLNFTNRFLQFANQAVYPFYILHQTLIVAAGYYVVKLNVSIWIKLVLLIIITFLTLYIIYRFLIRPFILTRILFGVKLKSKRQKEELASPVVAGLAK
jgi:glucan biosynthesis protein C